MAALTPPASHGGLALNDGTVLALDVAMAEIARRQRGLVSAAQLRGIGMTRAMIRHRVDRGWLHRRHSGVYAVGHLADIPFASEQAALLACGEGTVATHRSSAAVLRLLPPPLVPEVTVPRDRRPRHAGIVIHRSSTLRSGDIWVREGLRITSPRRTLHDLATVATPEELARAVNEAHARRLVPPGPLAIEPGRAGAARLRVASGSSAKGYTRSKAEELLRALVASAQLPPSRANVRVAGVLVDAEWPDHRLVVEVDGAATHAHQLDRDRSNEARLRSAGYDVLRFTWRQLTREPQLVVALIAGALARRSPA